MNLKRLYFKIVKHFYVLIRLTKVIKDLSERKGECKKCGICCGTCPALMFVNGKGFCRIYENRPYNCRISPLRIDFKSGRHKKECGFYYPK